MTLPPWDAWHAIVSHALDCLESRPLTVDVATREADARYFILTREGADLFLVLPNAFADADAFAGGKHHALTRALAWLATAETGARVVLHLEPHPAV
ncbi:MAG TPA: hypothetical protein VGR62_20600 [Candidatus Binatia bacterium]|jgi:hypothetical protein|nr:hypothetical protein [Candidatus Binatia bacterium]